MHSNVLIKNMNPTEHSQRLFVESMLTIIPFPSAKSGIPYLNASFDSFPLQTLIRMYLYILITS